jgi:Na+-translocating ferredoxin:NAD+ oxidoreductase RnfG subunit
MLQLPLQEGENHMMGFTWYCLGLLTTASAIFLWKYSKRYDLNGLSWSGLILGIVLILFSIAWAVGAVLEGVPRAGSMGLLLFGLSGIVLLTFTLRYTSSKRVKVAEPEAARAPVTEGVNPSISAKEEPSMPPVTGETVKTGIRYLAYISLVIAFIVGMTTEGKDYEGMVREKFSDQKLTKVNDDPVVFELGEKGEGAGNYVLIQEGQGYGGPFVIGVRIMEDARVHEVIPLDHKETPAYIKKIENTNYRDQYMGKHIADDFIVGVDLDAVSGATVTTMAAAEAVRRGAHIAAVEHFKLERTWTKVPWKFGLGEVLIIAIFALAFVTKVYTQKPWKYIYMAITIAVVGFYLNASISVGSLSGLLMGYVPGFRDHLIWWILTVGTVLAIIFQGKNVYCYRICPFHGIEFVLNKISGSRMNLPRKIMNQRGFIANFFLWLALMTIFLASHPALGAYEPFAMMFSLEGVGVQWYILPAALIGAFFMKIYWCRFFCPTGHAFNNLLKFRRKVVSLFKK